jgi:hypothetical protein
MARLSLEQRIKRDVAAANEYWFGGGRERAERAAAEAATPRPNANFYCSGVSPLGGVAQPAAEGKKR